VGFRITPVDTSGTPTGSGSEFIIYEPNFRQHTGDLAETVTDPENEPETEPETEPGSEWETEPEAEPEAEPEQEGETGSEDAAELDLTVEEETAAEEEALVDEEAPAENEIPAENKAEAMATASGMTISGLESLSENQSYDARYAIMSTAAKDEASGISTGIRAGGVSVSASVTAVYCAQ